jgi:hypothetical protein
MLPCFSQDGLVKKSKFFGIEPGMEGPKTIFLAAMAKPAA